MKRRPLPVAVAMMTVTALLLTACGSGDDKIADAGQGRETSRESTEPSPPLAEDRPDGVDVSLPSDVDLVFDWDKPEDGNEAAAMDDAANYLRAIYRGVAKRTTKDAAVTAYSTGGGLHYADTQINAWIDGGWTATGTLRHYNATSRSTPNGQSVAVAFCADSGTFYGREINTKKVLRTKPSIEDFDYFKIIMVKFPTRKDLWQASKVFVETNAAKCR
ncbi:hypothetical protein AB0D89_17810 [Streptomyces luteogriseus]|uniref:hypothetical protein n=1 Tax=Streptomyces luteogriseus TaxID=68233 RepID=UPI0033E904EC